MSEANATARFFLGRDESSHWYLVPVERKEEWDAWTELSEDDEESWDERSFAGSGANGRIGSVQLC